MTIYHLVNFGVQYCSYLKKANLLSETIQTVFNLHVKAI